MAPVSRYDDEAHSSDVSLYSTGTVFGKVSGTAGSEEGVMNPVKRHDEWRWTLRGEGRSAAMAEHAAAIVR
jgi:hypothetical protein